MNRLQRLEALAERASERPWSHSPGYGAVVTHGEGRNLAGGADDFDGYGGHLVFETCAYPDRDFVCEMANSWVHIREVLATLAKRWQGPDGRTMPADVRAALRPLLEEIGLAKCEDFGLCSECGETIEGERSHHKPTCSCFSGSAA